MENMFVFVKSGNLRHILPKYIDMMLMVQYFKFPETHFFYWNKVGAFWWDVERFLNIKICVQSLTWSDREKIPHYIEEVGILKKWVNLVNPLPSNSNFMSNNLQCTW